MFFMTANGKCSCKGKDGVKKNLYLSELEAVDMANYRRSSDGVPLRVYACPDGGGWHLTKTF